MRQSATVRSFLVLGGVVVAMVSIGASWIEPGYYPATWLGLILLFLLAAACTSCKAFFVGGAVGTGALFIAFHWVPEAFGETLDLAPWVAWSIFAGMIAHEAVPFGIVAMLASRWLAVSVPRMWGIAAVWVAFEVYWPKIFPWSFAHSQTDALPLLQMAEVVGAPGISALMIAVVLIPAAHVSHAVRRRSGIASVPVKGYSSLALLIFAFAVGFGFYRQHAWEQYAVTRPPLRIALVQVDPSYSDSIEKMRRRSLSAEDAIELVCWPESTLGDYCTSLDDFGSQEVTLAKSLPPTVDMQPTLGIDRDVLAGGRLYLPGTTEDGPFFQTGFLIHPGQTIGGRYLKRTLMPIGEYIPGETWFPVLRRLAGLQDIVATGDADSSLELQNGAKVGVLMCYDDMIAANARKSVEQGAQVLITLANGTAFTNPLALEQHMRLSLLRSVENRRYFARCAATGVTCIIAPTGAVAQRLDTNVEAMLTADVALLDNQTVYSRFGFLFAPACLTITIAWLLWAWWRGVWSSPRFGDKILRRAGNARAGPSSLSPRAMAGKKPHLNSKPRRGTRAPSRESALPSAS